MKTNKVVREVKIKISMERPSPDKLVTDSEKEYIEWMDKVCKEHGYKPSKLEDDDEEDD